MRRLKEFPWFGIIPLLLAIVSSEWLAEILKYWLIKIPFLRNELLLLVMSIALFLISIFLLYHYRKSFLGIRTLQQVKTRPLKALIILLSTPRPCPADYSFPITIKEGGTEVTINGESLKDDINALNKIKWNWQQILRGIEPHQNRLKYLYLIGSKESFNYLDKAGALIKQYCSNINVFKANEPVEFEELEKLTKVIYSAISILKDVKDERLGDDDIIIDITGGQKVSSIAGAVVTLNSSVRFQYVQTDKFFEVISYDMTIQSEISI